jgi:hypothetical protein
MVVAAEAAAARRVVTIVDLWKISGGRKRDEESP